MFVIPKYLYTIILLKKYFCFSYHKGCTQVHVMAKQLQYNDEVLIHVRDVEMARTDPGNCIDINRGYSQLRGKLPSLFFGLVTVSPFKYFNRKVTNMYSLHRTNKYYLRP